MNWSETLNPLLYYAEAIGIRSRWARRFKRRERLWPAAGAAV